MVEYLFLWSPYLQFLKGLQCTRAPQGRPYTYFRIKVNFYYTDFRHDPCRNRVSSHPSYDDFTKEYITVKSVMDSVVSRPDKRFLDTSTTCFCKKFQKLYWGWNPRRTPSQKTEHLEVKIHECYWKLQLKTPRHSTRGCRQGSSPPKSRTVPWVTRKWFSSFLRRQVMTRGISSVP